MEGRIVGRVSDDGKAYELVQRGRVLKSIDLDEARQDPKLSAAILRNGWDKSE